MRWRVAARRFGECESEQKLLCISGETSRLLAPTLAVLNGDFVASILNSVSISPYTFKQSGVSVGVGLHGGVDLHGRIGLG